MAVSVMSPVVADRSEPAARALPIVKWAGGKARLIPEILQRMPGSYGRYHEPFLGGGALFFHLAPEAAEIADANVALIDMYSAVAGGVDDVIARLRALRDDHVAGGLAAYLATRARFNALASGGQSVRGADAAAMFIYLNKTCFNGLWRVNRRAGHFNVPYGKRDAWCAVGEDGEDGLRGIEDGLRAAAAVLARPGISMTSGSFAYQMGISARRPRAGDFAYFDPPYDGTFDAYTTSGFTADDQEMLSKWVHHLAENGVKVMASNADTPLIRSLYSGLRIDVVQAARAINSDGAGRGKVDELIIMGGYR